MPSAGDTLSLGALGKAVGAYGDITSETALAGDGRGSAAETSLSQFYISEVSSMTVPDDTPLAGTTATATFGFTSAGSLFLSRIASVATNFTWNETDGGGFFALTLISDYTAPIAYTSAGDIEFTGKFSDGFNDHATGQYNRAIIEEATIGE